MTNDTDNALQATLLAETSKIAWKELQYFFAGGKVIQISPGVDLVKVAEHIARDDSDIIQQMMQSGEIAPVSTEQAKLWYDSDSSVWAVVVKPWVLVQEISGRGHIQ